MLIVTYFRVDIVPIETMHCMINPLIPLIKDPAVIYKLLFASKTIIVCATLASQQVIFIHR